MDFGLTTLAAASCHFCTPPEALAAELHQHWHCRVRRDPINMERSASREPVGPDQGNMSYLGIHRYSEQISLFFSLAPKWSRYMKY